MAQTIANHCYKNLKRTVATRAISALIFFFIPLLFFLSAPTLCPADDTTPLNIASTSSTNQTPGAETRSGSTRSSIVEISPTDTHLQSNSRLEKNQSWIYTGFVALGVVALLFIIICLYNFRQKQRTERHLQQSQEKLQMLVSQGDFHLWSVDRDLKFTESLGGGLKDLGLKPNQIVDEGLDLYSFFQSDSPEVPAINAHLKTLQGEVSTYDDQYDGHFFRSQTSPRWDADGNIIGCIGIALDITQQKKIEQALAESEAKYRLLFERSNDPMIILDRQQLSIANHAAARVFGYDSPEHMTGLGAAAFSAPLQADGSRSEQKIKGMNAIAFEQGHHHFEWLCKRDNGEIFPAEISLTPIALDGRPALFAIATDISERKKVEEAMRNARLAAEAATRAKSEFLANMSHEIRTPMNGIIGFTDLAMQSQLTDKQYNYIEKANRSATNLLSILNDILDFSAIESGKLEIEKSEFRLKEILDNMVNLVRLKAKEKDLRLQVKVDQNVPTALIGDPLRASQVLINLAGNAVKFSHPGNDVMVAVSLQQETENEATLIFSITDTGIGISKEQLEKLFQPFIQADTSVTREYGGTGLGLTISQEIAHMMGGRVWVDSELDRGSTFHFSACFEKQQKDA